MKLDDIEDVAWMGVVIAVGLFVVGLLVLFGCFVAYNVAEWSDQRECAARSGKVEHYDSDRRSLWRCTVPTPERAP